MLDKTTDGLTCVFNATINDSGLKQQIEPLTTPSPHHPRSVDLKKKHSTSEGSLEMLLKTEFIHLLTSS